ncbi:MAG TPA: hypothetical protein VLI07_18725 [Candidatus Binatus sp.]|nr:hypothetical protein [Candidatus Binatus sp.]
MQEMVAEIIRVKEDGDWYRIFTDNDDVERLDTKDEDKAREAAGLKGKGPSLIVFNQRTRPKRDGKGVWEDNYYDHAEPYVERQQKLPLDDGIERGGDDGKTMSRTHPETAWRISLGTGVKVAMLLLPNVAEEQRTIERVKGLAREVAEFLFFEPVPDYPSTPLATTPGFRAPRMRGFGERDWTPDPGPDPSHPGYGDDDIPFDATR